VPADSNSVIVIQSSVRRIMPMVRVKLHWLAVPSPSAHQVQDFTDSIWLL